MLPRLGRTIARPRPLRLTGLGAHNFTRTRRHTAPTDPHDPLRTEADAARVAAVNATVRAKALDAENTRLRDRVSDLLKEKQLYVMWMPRAKAARDAARAASAVVQSEWGKRARAEASASTARAERQKLAAQVQQVMSAEAALDDARRKLVEMAPGEGRWLWSGRTGSQGAAGQQRDIPWWAKLALALVSYALVKKYERDTVYDAFMKEYSDKKMVAALHNVREWEYLRVEVYHADPTKPPEEHNVGKLVHVYLHVFGRIIAHVAQMSTTPPVDMFERADVAAQTKVLQRAIELTENKRTLNWKDHEEKYHDLPDLARYVMQARALRSILEMLLRTPLSTLNRHMFVHDDMADEQRKHKRYIRVKQTPATSATVVNFELVPVAQVKGVHPVRERDEFRVESNSKATIDQSRRDLGYFYKRFTDAWLDNRVPYDVGIPSRRQLHAFMTTVVPLDDLNRVIGLPRLPGEWDDALPLQRMRVRFKSGYDEPGFFDWCPISSPMPTSVKENAPDTWKDHHRPLNTTDPRVPSLAGFHPAICGVHIAHKGKIDTDTLPLVNFETVAFQRWPTNQEAVLGRWLYDALTHQMHPENMYDCVASRVLNLLSAVGIPVHWIWHVVTHLRGLTPEHPLVRGYPGVVSRGDTRPHLCPFEKPPVVDWEAPDEPAPTWAQPPEMSLPNAAVSPSGATT